MSLIREFKIVDGVPFIMCPPFFVPEFQLYDMLEDGTKRYIVNLVPSYSVEGEKDESKRS